MPLLNMDQILKDAFEHPLFLCFGESQDKVALEPDIELLFERR
jgi:hypothetical protein